MIKLMTEFRLKDDGLIKRKLTLVGDAFTGVISAVLSQIDDKSDAGHKELVPELDWIEIQKCLQVTGNESVWQLQ